METKQTQMLSQPCFNVSPHPWGRLDMRQWCQSPAFLRCGNLQYHPCTLHSTERYPGAM